MASRMQVYRAVAIVVILVGVLFAYAEGTGDRSADGNRAVAGWEACSCPSQGDIDGSGFIDPFDLGQIIDILYGQAPDVQDPDCPTSRSDFNGDGCPDALDLGWLFAHAFEGVRGPIDPCTCPGGFPCEPEAGSNLGSVVVESKSVAPGAADVIGVFIDNGTQITGLVIPLVIREVTPGVYPTSLTPGFTPGSRIDGSLTALQSHVTTFDTDDGSCSTGGSGGFGTPGSLSLSSPDGVMFTRQGLPYLPAGSDGSTPSISIGFTAPLVEGFFEIDTTCIDPCHHLMFIEEGSSHPFIPSHPSFTKGIIEVGDPPGCENSTCDRYFLACPRGDIEFEIELIDGNGEPMAGYSAVELDFSDCSPTEFFPLPGAYPDWPIVTADQPADADGIVRFAIAAGGDCPDCSVLVTAACGFTRTVPVRCTDVDGNAWVQFADYDDGLGLCRDLNADDVVDDADYIRHLAHCCDHRFPGDPCDWLSQEITLTPDGGFGPDDEILVHWRLDNNIEGDACDVDSVVLFQSEWTTTPIWERVDVMVRNMTVLPGDFDIDSLSYTVPDFGKMCLRTRLFTSCCSPYQDEKVCVDVVRQCPPDAVCFEFLTLKLADADSYGAEHTLRLDLGWTVDTVKVGDTMKTTICTSDITPAGTDGTFTWRYTISGDENDFSYRVVQELFMGDMTGPATPRLPDCFVDVFDMNLLIDYLFVSGPPPIPPENADLDCDGFPTALDMSIIIDVLFASAQPPEPCDGGPG